MRTVDEGDGLGAVGALPHELDAVGAAEHQGEPGPYERVVVDDGQPDRWA